MLLLDHELLVDRTKNSLTDFEERIRVLHHGVAPSYVTLSSITIEIDVEFVDDLVPNIEDQLETRNVHLDAGNPKRLAGLRKF